MLSEARVIPLLSAKFKLFESLFYAPAINAVTRRLKTTQTAFSGRYINRKNEGKIRAGLLSADRLSRTKIKACNTQ